MIWLLDITTAPGWSELSFKGALVIAVVWLWRKMEALNKQREDDLQLWKTTYQDMMKQQIESTAQQTKVIDHNTTALEAVMELMQEVKEKFKSHV